MDANSDTMKRGEAVAAILAGAWRVSPPPLDVSGQMLTAAAGLLAVGGAGGLGWRRVSDSPLKTSAEARELRQHYRLQTLQAADRERAILTLLARLRAAGVEPILIKGWSSACLYPEAGLRPSCDVDLCVPAGQFQAAAAALGGPPLPCLVDLHADVPDSQDRSWSEVFGRSRLAMLDKSLIRVLGPEDQLRLLCLHCARHGVARPLWLCDIGACLESLPPDFDWDYCLWGRKHLTAWVVSMLGLACSLLGSHCEAGAKRPAPWLQRAVLWCWGVGAGRPVNYYVRHPIEIARRLRYHGISPNRGSTPIKAALQLGLGPHWWLPLMAVQLAAFARRKVPHVVERMLRRRHRVWRPFNVH